MLKRAYSVASRSVPLIMLGIASTSVTVEAFELTPTDGPAIISDQLSNTNKVKILRMPDGTLISVYRLEQVFNAGNNIFITFNASYCPADDGQCTGRRNGPEPVRARRSLQDRRALLSARSREASAKNVSGLLFATISA